MVPFINRGQQEELRSQMMAQQDQAFFQSALTDLFKNKTQSVWQKLDASLKECLKNTPLATEEKHREALEVIVKIARRELRFCEDALTRLQGFTLKIKT